MSTEWEIAAPATENKGYHWFDLRLFNNRCFWSRTSVAAAVAHQKKGKTCMNNLLMDAVVHRFGQNIFFSYLVLLSQGFQQFSFVTVSIEQINMLFRRILGNSRCSSHSRFCNDLWPSHHWCQRPILNVNGNVNYIRIRIHTTWKVYHGNMEAKKYSYIKTNLTW